MKRLLTIGLTAALSAPSLAVGPADGLAATGRWSAYTAGPAGTPPMGWSSWNAFATDIDEDKIVDPVADPMIYRTAAGWAGTSGAGDRPIYAGWGGARADSTPYGQVLQVAGRPFAAGIGILANSRMEVRNDGAQRFTAMVGVDDSATDKGHSVTFAIYGDGKLLGTSQALKWGMPATPLSAPVAGVKLIELVARSRREQRATTGNLGRCGAAGTLIQQRAATEPPAGGGIPVLYLCSFGAYLQIRRPITRA